MYLGYFSCLILKFQKLSENIEKILQKIIVKNFACAMPVKVDENVIK
jgi:hypothetical protein